MALGLHHRTSVVAMPMNYWQCFISVTLMVLGRAGSLVNVRLKQVSCWPSDILVWSSDLPMDQAGSESSVSSRLKAHIKGNN